MSDRDRLAALLVDVLTEMNVRFYGSVPPDPLSDCDVAAEMLIAAGVGFPDARLREALYESNLMLDEMRRESHGEDCHTNRACAARNRIAQNNRLLNEYHRASLGEEPT